MTQNPLFNAAAAFAYIGLVILGISQFEGAEGPDTLLIPMAMLSLFVLSAAVMGYVFLYHPILHALGGEPVQGVKLFLHTLGIFALLTFVLFAALVWVARAV